MSLEDSKKKDRDDIKKLLQDIKVDALEPLLRERGFPSAVIDDIQIPEKKPFDSLDNWCKSSTDQEYLLYGCVLNVLVDFHLSAKVEESQNTLRRKFQLPLSCGLADTPHPVVRHCHFKRAFAHDVKGLNIPESELCRASVLFSTLEPVNLPVLARPKEEEMTRLGSLPPAHHESYQPGEYSCDSSFKDEHKPEEGKRTKPEDASSSNREPSLPVPEEEAINAYRMEKWPRGKCIIINNKDFGEHARTRIGSEKDVQRMEHVFRCLHFDCFVFFNLKADEMRQVLRWAAEEKQQVDSDCLVVVLSSHGSNSTILGVDGKRLHLYRDAFPAFNDTNCPTLKGKPKIFFVQACRNEQQDMRNEHAEPFPGRPGNGDPWRDMYIAHSTLPGYKSFRHRKDGSRLLSSVYEVFQKAANTKSFEHLMKLVQVRMRGLERPEQFQTPSFAQEGFIKEVYFNRDYTSSFQHRINFVRMILSQTYLDDIESLFKEDSPASLLERVYDEQQPQEQVFAVQ